MNLPLKSWPFHGSHPAAAAFAAPIDPAATVTLYRAQSLLVGFISDRDGRMIGAGEITTKQAMDVIAYCDNKGSFQ